VARDANGRAMLRLSVRLTPRIEGAATLAQCPLFSGSDGSGVWPASAQCRFELRVSGDGGPGPTFMPPVSPAWRRSTRRCPTRRVAR
jgi:hypothetical protein